MNDIDINVWKERQGSFDSIMDHIKWIKFQEYTRGNLSLTGADEAELNRITNDTKEGYFLIGILSYRENMIKKAPNYNINIHEDEWIRHYDSPEYQRFIRLESAARGMNHLRLADIITKIKEAE